VTSGLEPVALPSVAECLSQGLFGAPHKYKGVGVRKEERKDERMKEAKKERMNE
jgi:hypothetical protein